MSNVTQMSVNPLVMALIATLGTWLVTAAGAATVVFFRSTNQRLLNTMLGFAAGVMIAASFWSLLQPAIEQAALLGLPAALIAAGGFVSGAAFIWGADMLISRARHDDGSYLHRVMMLMSAITLHNIPEGVAVGVAFGALYANYTPDSLLAAISVAVGIGLQNFPEGAAVSIPLRREGVSRWRCFLYGQASGVVEPIAGVLGAGLVVYVQSLLPFMLSFAAGAMILVVVHELIPECQHNKQHHPYLSTMGIIAGFVVMMLLDVTLG